jgi:hypothetical protein
VLKISPTPLIALSLLSLQLFVAPGVLAAKRPKYQVANDRPLNADIMNLADRLARNPELMSLSYVKYALGNPSKSAGSYDGVTYSWNPRLSGPADAAVVVLALRTNANRQTIGSVMNIELPDSDVTLDEVEKREQTIGKKFYDNNCFPALRFSFQPNTSLTYTQKQNTFSVNHIEIAYSGPPLPPPSPQQILDISNDRRMKALAALSNGQNLQSTPLLEQHLAENPHDAEAHYALGIAYQNSSHINEAIAQYKLGLVNAANDPDVTNKCIQRLQALQVIPDPNQQVDFHHLALKNHGQGLTEGDVQSSTSKGSLITHNQPMSNAPQGPLPFNGPANQVTPPPSVAPSFNSLSPTNIMNHEAGAFPSNASGINPGF